eukprot:scaffold14736_cov114-Isochrysis_galbana.AAC.7
MYGGPKSSSNALPPAATSIASHLDSAPVTAAAYDLFFPTWPALALEPSGLGAARVAGKSSGRVVGRGCECVVRGHRTRPKEFVFCGVASRAAVGACGRGQRQPRGKARKRTGQEQV